jgi:hypothetical protein
MRASFRDLFPLLLATIAAGCVAESGPEPASDEPVDDETFALDPADEGELDAQKAKVCVKRGRFTVRKGSARCKYPCTPNGDACFGAEIASCEVWHCGKHGKVPRNCKFVRCSLGQQRGW